MAGTKTVQYQFGCYAQQESAQDKYPGESFYDNMFAWIFDTLLQINDNFGIFILNW